jgi:hypothetical protein
VVLPWTMGLFPRLSSNCRGLCIDRGVLEGETDLEFIGGSPVGPDARPSRIPGLRVRRHIILVLFCHGGAQALYRCRPVLNLTAWALRTAEVRQGR